MVEPGTWAAKGRVTVLLATHNGARFIDEQLSSIAAQDWPAIDVIASDDGSSDDTGAALRRWAARWAKGSFTVLAGPQRGFAANFRFLLTRDEIATDFVAFSDQDDIWLLDKLTVAAEALRPYGGAPALFCSRTLIVDEAGKEIGRSPAFARPVGFANALVQSIAGGNTMVLNRPAFELVREAARRTEFVSHDWFCYLLVSGAGGEVVFAQRPMVRYRQHGENLVGANTGPLARLSRIFAALGGRFTRWNATNIAGLKACRDLLSPDGRARLDAFIAAREAPVFRRLAALRRTGVYRQTRAGQISLVVAALLGKL